MENRKFNYAIAKKFWRFLTKKLRLQNGAKECIAQISARAFQRVFTCKNRRRFSRERAPRSLGKNSIHYSLHSLLINRSYQAIGFLPQRQVYQQNQANRDNVKLIAAQAPQRDNEEHKKCSVEPASRSPKSCQPGSIPMTTHGRSTRVTYREGEIVKSQQENRKCRKHPWKKRNQ